MSLQGVGMDLAQSILKELITLQNKNEELARIITKLEHESDVIIQQFETKIEELQKGLKHEQDDKSRASRRYEEEIRDLEGSKEALIREITQVRETFQERVSGLEKEVSAQIASMEVREKEHSDLLDENKKTVALFENNIVSLKKDLSDLEESSRNETAGLSLQIETLTETLRNDRTHYSGIINQKEDDIKKARETILFYDARIRDLENRRRSLEIQSGHTIDHLHHLINTERQIRSRELRERDELARDLGNKITAADLRTRDTETRLQEEKAVFEEKITLLNRQISESLDRNSFLEKEISTITSDIGRVVDDHDELARKQEEIFNQERKTLENSIGTLTEQLRVLEMAYSDDLRTWTDERESMTHQISTLKEAHQREISDRQEMSAEFTKTISALESEHAILSERSSEAFAEQSRLLSKLKESEETFEKERHLLQNEIAIQRTRFEERDQVTRREMSSLKDSLNEVVLEREQIITSKQQREEYYRGEVARLHTEVSDLHVVMKEAEDRLVREVAGRDTQITALSLNNEKIRAEVDRVRHQLGRLHATIRAEKDDSVHALYREITSLEEKIAGKDIEIKSLSERLLRLDAENTRLLQNLTKSTSQDSAGRSDIPPGKADTRESALDPRRRDVAVLAADLEDPTRAAEAAGKLTAMGSDVVDLLIPLLHTGSIQRRVWIAVVLYELNDNRATLPLMKLLETPKVHFRELIWEAKNQFHTHIRVGTPVEPAVGIRAGPGGPGLNR